MGFTKVSQVSMRGRNKAAMIATETQFLAPHKYSGRVLIATQLHRISSQQSCCSEKRQIAKTSGESGLNAESWKWSAADIRGDMSHSCPLGVFTSHRFTFSPPALTCSQHQQGWNYTIFHLPDDIGFLLSAPLAGLVVPCSDQKSTFFPLSTRPRRSLSELKIF